MRALTIRRILILASAVLLGGICLTLINLIQNSSLRKAGVAGFVDALLVVLFVTAVHWLFRDRLRVFNPAQQWLLRTIFYVFALVIAFIIGLFFKAYFFGMNALSLGTLYEKFWDTLVHWGQHSTQRTQLGEVISPVITQIAVTFLALVFFISLASVLGSWVEVKWQESRFKQAREKAELTALRAQMDPHFLFNSLNTITGLVKLDAGKAEQLLIELSELMRYLFNNASAEKISLQNEIAFTKHYLDLLQARFPKKLMVEWQINTANQSLLIPTFLLQPLIENAVRHGWKNQEQPLKLHIEISEQPATLLFKLTDNGQGIAPVLKDKFLKPGHALANLQDRLALFYHKKNLLQVNSEWKVGTSVEIRIPKN